MPVMKAPFVPSNRRQSYRTGAPADKRLPNEFRNGATNGIRTQPSSMCSIFILSLPWSVGTSRFGSSRWPHVPKQAPRLETGRCLVMRRYGVVSFNLPSVLGLLPVRFPQATRRPRRAGLRRTGLFTVAVRREPHIQRTVSE